MSEFEKYLRNADIRSVFKHGEFDEHARFIYLFLAETVKKQCDTLVFSSTTISRFKSTQGLDYVPLAREIELIKHRREILDKIILGDALIKQHIHLISRTSEQSVYQITYSEDNK